MYRELSKLIIYRDLKKDSILSRLGDVFEDFNTGSDTPEHLRTRIFIEVRRLLDLATQYGFNKNLWHNYLTYLLVNHENAFSMACEIRGFEAEANVMRVLGNYALQEEA